EDVVGSEVLYGLLGLARYHCPHAASGRREGHLDVDVIAGGNLDVVNETEVYYADWYLGVVDVQEGLIDLLFGDLRLDRPVLFYLFEADALLGLVLFNAYNFFHSHGVSPCPGRRSIAER